MNLVDFIIIGIVAVSVLFGIYRGFISSVLNVGGGLLAFGLSFVTYPHLAGFVRGNDELIRTLENYTDASKLAGDLQIKASELVQQGQQAVSEAIGKISLPQPLGALLEANLSGTVYGDVPVNEYVAQTVLQSSINILCFLASFIVLYIVLSIIINAIKAVFQLPILKQLDGLAGGAFGLLRGVLICAAAFTLVPLITTVAPVESVTELIEQSRLAKLFTENNLILFIMNRRL